MTPPRITPLPPIFPFGWAVAHGEDEHGLWQEFDLAGQRQRLRWLPPGRFLMGSPPEEPQRGEDELQHPVVLTSGFWLADTTCTQALWAAALDGDAPSHFAGRADCPVEQVSWHDVTERFFPALNEAIPGLQACLPTEAQWEYACREAGTAWDAFSFGDSLSAEQANFDRNHPYGSARPGPWRQETMPVRSFAPNAHGLWQMHGNVLEWVDDVYASYGRGEVHDPHVLPTAEAAGLRVLRGGSWFDSARDCRSAQRDAAGPGYRYRYIGFRLARGPS